MMLRRLAMKVFTPRRLAYQDIKGVYWTIVSQKPRAARGSMMSEWTLIPEADLRHLLVLMEQRGFIERDPGPFDAAYTVDVYRSWWGPGPHWEELAEQYGRPL